METLTNVIGVLFVIVVVVIGTLFQVNSCFRVSAGDTSHGIVEEYLFE